MSVLISMSVVPALNGQALHFSEIDTYTDKYLLVVALVKYAVTGKFLVSSVKFSIKFSKSK